MVLRSRARRALLVSSALGLMALSLTACSPPIIGSVTLARLPDGAVVAVVVLCEGTLTKLELTHSAVDEESEGAAVAWTGEVSTHGTTVIPLTGTDWQAEAGQQYYIDGSGEVEDTGLVPLGGGAVIRGEGEIAADLLEGLGPGEVVEWDASRQRAVAVSLTDYEDGRCGSAPTDRNAG